MMQVSALTSGTWAAGKFASAASAGVWAAGSSQFGGRGLHARWGAFADTLSSTPSRPVHARVQHLAQPDGLRASRSSLRLAPRWATNWPDTTLILERRKMNNWSPRTIKGLSYAFIGILAFKAQPLVTAALRDSLFWSGLSQAGFSLIGLCSMSIGIYLLATRYKK